MTLERIKGFIPLNFDLMKNPVNWVIVTLIVVGAGMAFAAIIPENPSTTEN